MTDKRILLVEDEPEVRRPLTHTLLAAGYRVDVAATAAEQADPAVSIARRVGALAVRPRGPR